MPWNSRRYSAPLVALSLLLGSLVIATPSISRLFGQAIGASGPLQPFTSLSFEDPFGAAFGLIPEQPIVVIVGNSTGADDDFIVRVSDGRLPDNLIAVSVRDGAVEPIVVTPRPGATELRISIDNRPRPVEIRAKVLP